MTIDLSDAFAPLQSQPSTSSQTFGPTESGVALKVDGVRYSGWKTARVTRSIESIAGTFSLSTSERWANQAQAWPINEGDECSLTVNGETLITGFVDAFSPSYGPEEHAVEIGGRDKVADFVDSSANLDVWEFTNADVVKLAQKLCQPHGVSVSVLAAALPGRSILATGKLSISVGETGFNILEQACRLAGVLVVSDGLGGIIITRPATARATTELIEGQNILTASARFDVSGRFATYKVLGQHAATDNFFGHQAAHVLGQASDPNVTRANRVMVLRPEGQVTNAYAQRRAQWEATNRAARANTASITVQGWTQANGDLWPVNALVRVNSPRLRINGDMLISEATYAVNDSEGTTTVLSLKPPNAFDPEPTVTHDGLWKELKGGV